jgi:hypothetical protein
MLLRGVDDNGDPIEISVEPCPSCGALVYLMVMSLDEHARAVHPST